jgi:hypothetical protein
MKSLLLFLSAISLVAAGVAGKWFSYTAFEQYAP